MLLSVVDHFNTIFVVATALACCYVQKSSGNISPKMAEKFVAFGKASLVATVATLLYFLSSQFSSCPTLVPEGGAKPGATVVCPDGTTSVLPPDVEVGDSINCGDCTEDCGCGWFDWLTGCGLNQIICVYNCSVAGFWLHFGHRHRSNPAATTLPPATNATTPLPKLATKAPTSTVGNPTYGIVSTPAAGQLDQTKSFNVADFDLSLETSTPP